NRRRMMISQQRKMRKFHKIFSSIRFIRILAMALILPVGNVFASDAPPAAPEHSEDGREKVLMDFGWKFHLGDAPDVGNQFDYPEVKDLAKTHVDEIGQQGELENLSDAVT